MQIAHLTDFQGSGSFPGAQLKYVGCMTAAYVLIYHRHPCAIGVIPRAEWRRMQPIGLSCTYEEHGRIERKQATTNSIPRLRKEASTCCGPSTLASSLHVAIREAIATAGQRG